MIYTSFGYGTVEDEKTVAQLSNKKYIKVKKGKEWSIFGRRGVFIINV